MITLREKQNVKPREGRASREEKAGEPAGREKPFLPSSLSGEKEKRKR